MSRNNPNYLIFFTYLLLSSCALVSCATHTGAQGQMPCLDEACLNEVIRDPSKGDVEKYLRIKYAITHGFDLGKANSYLLEKYAALASFSGSYEEAENIYALVSGPNNNLDPSKGGYVHAAPADPVVRALARNTRAVFINEAHVVARSRASIYTLLQPLHEEGYTYLAIEGLSVLPAERGDTCANSVISDKNLSERGYPLRETGFYIREPIYGEIIRHALRLGYKLIAYETSDATDRSIEGREEKQAQNLACAINGDPTAKVIVIAGFGHIAKSLNAGVPGGMMAARFKRITGIDPLSIDTTKLLNFPEDAFQFVNKDDRQDSFQAYVLYDSERRLYGTENYDLIMTLPKLADRGGDGLSWLDLNGARTRVSVSLSECKNTFPCVLEAYSAVETAGIPSDRCIAMGNEAACRLFLPKGSFIVKFYNSKLLEINSRAILVDR